MPKAISEGLEKRLQEMGGEERILVDIVPVMDNGFPHLVDLLWEMNPKRFSYYRKKNEIDAYLSRAQIYEVAKNAYMQAILEKPLKT